MTVGNRATSNIQRVLVGDYGTMISIDLDNVEGDSITNVEWVRAYDRSQVLPTEYIDIPDFNVQDGILHLTLPSIPRGRYRLEIKDEDGRFYPAQGELLLEMLASTYDAKEYVFITYYEQIMDEVEGMVEQYIIANPDGFKGEKGDTGEKGDPLVYEDLTVEEFEELKNRIVDEVPIDVLDDIADLRAYVGYNDEQIVGVEADLENRRVTRLAGAVNRTPGQSFNDIRAFGGRRRVTLSDAGEVLGYHGETGYDETGTTGQVMVEQPAFYYKVVPLKLDKIEDGKGYHMRKARYYVSDSPKAGFKLHPAFIDVNNRKRPYVYLSAFEGSIYDTSEGVYLKNDEQQANFTEDLLSSIPGAKPASGVSQSLHIVNTRTLAENRGIGWGQANAATVSVSQLLFIIEYASFNTQNELGGGVTGKPSGEGNESELTGATRSLGNRSGFVENENGYEVPAYRGEENWYGNNYKWVDGINYQGDEDRRNVYIATHDFESNTDQAPYRDAGFSLPGGSGYVSAFGYGTDEFDWLFIGTEYSGNSSVPVGDFNYSNNTGWRVASLGGSWNNGADAGGFLWSLSTSSGYSTRTRGGRLVYAPKIFEDA